MGGIAGSNAMNGGYYSINLIVGSNAINAATATLELLDSEHLLLIHPGITTQVKT